MRSVLKIGLAVLASLVGACGESEFAGGGGGTGPRAADQVPGDEPGTEVDGDRIKQTFTAEDYTRPVDIAIAFDTSGSMKEELESLQSNINLFISELTSHDIDAIVTIIANQSPVVGTPLVAHFEESDRLKTIDRFVGSTDAIAHLTAYYEGRYNFPAPMRAESHLEALIVSDDDGALGAMADDFLPPPDRKVTVNAVVGIKATNTNTCKVMKVGSQHIKLQKKTGGTLLDICTPDWSEMIKSLSQNIAQRQMTFILEHEPNTDAEIIVRVNGDKLDAKHYSVDRGKRLLKFKESFNLPPKSEVLIEYFLVK